MVSMADQVTCKWNSNDWNIIYQTKSPPTMNLIYIKQYS